MNVSTFSGLFSKNGKKSMTNSNTCDMNTKFLLEFHNMILNYTSSHPTGAKHFPYFTDVNGSLPTMQDVMTWFEIVYASMEVVSSEELTCMNELLTSMQELQINTIKCGNVGCSIHKLQRMIKEIKTTRGIEIYNRHTIA